MDTFRRDTGWLFHVHMFCSDEPSLIRFRVLGNWTGCGLKDTPHLMILMLGVSDVFVVSE